MLQNQGPNARASLNCSSNLLLRKPVVFQVVTAWCALHILYITGQAHLSGLGERLLPMA